MNRIHFLLAFLAILGCQSKTEKALEPKAFSAFKPNVLGKRS